MLLIPTFPTETEPCLDCFWAGGAGLVAVPPWGGGGRSLPAHFPADGKGFVIPVICWQMGQVEQGEGTDTFTPASSPVVLDKLIIMLGRF